MCPPGSSKTEVLKEKMIYNYFPSKGGFLQMIKDDFSEDLYFIYRMLIRFIHM